MSNVGVSSCYVIHLHNVVTRSVHTSTLPSHPTSAVGSWHRLIRLQLTWKHPHDTLMVLGTWTTSNRKQYAVRPKNPTGNQTGARSCGQQLFADHSRLDVLGKMLARTPVPYGFHRLCSRGNLMGSRTVRRFEYHHTKHFTSSLFIQFCYGNPQP